MELFGERVRYLREARHITLRRFADMIDVSPTFVSKMERGEFKPPGEATIVAIAEVLGQNKDEMLAMAGKLSSDLPPVIHKYPSQMADFLRLADHLGATPGDLQAMAEVLRHRRGEQSGVQDDRATNHPRDGDRQRHRSGR